MAKQRFDRLDAEAEREGSAFTRLKRDLAVRRPMGKRIAKIRRGHQAGATMIETRIDKRYMA